MTNQSRLNAVRHLVTAARDRLHLAANAVLKAGRQVPQEAQQTIGELNDAVRALGELQPTPEPQPAPAGTPAALAITISPNATGNPPGKLADAELHFLAGPLQGSKLIGFAIWERRGGSGRNVTFPARQYSVNGERRSFALLRPSHLDPDRTNTVGPAGDPTATIRELVLDAYDRHEQQPDAARWLYDQDGRSLDAPPSASQPEPPMGAGYDVPTDEPTPPAVQASQETTSPAQDPPFADLPGTAPAVKTGAVVRDVLDAQAQAGRALGQAMQQFDF